MPDPAGHDSLGLVSGEFLEIFREWETMSEQAARCPHCGAIQGGAAAALVALYEEVARLKQLAEEEAQAREAELLREIRLLRETVARLRSSSLCYGYLTDPYRARK